MIAQQGTLEISRARLLHNLKLLRQRIGNATLCATIKADAYGHGVDLVADLLVQEDVKWACVYSLPEALNLARFHPFNLLVLAPLVLHQPNPGMVRHILDHGGARQLADIAPRLGDGKTVPAGVRLNVTDIRTAECLAESIRAIDPAAIWPIHVQIDTGLTRNGIAPARLPELLARIAQLPTLQLEGLFAHFSHGDVPNHPTVHNQLTAFRHAAEPFKKSRPDLLIHLQNSGGTLHLGNAGMDMVRVGIALYGLQPSTDEPIPGLLPIARLVAPVIATHEVPANTGVGYGHTFMTKRLSKLAIVPVGYADGYPRQLTNRSIAQLREQNVPVVGRVSMDQIILDLTDHPASSAILPGEPVTVISSNPTDQNCLDAMADCIGTIGYELATHLGSRLRRMVVA